jgi:tetratricopeptide (TPR) repeat protein
MSLQTLIRLGTIVTAAGLVLQPAFPQAKGGSTAGGGSTGAGAGAGAGAGTGSTSTAGPGATTRPTTIPNTTQPTQPQPPQPMQPMFLSGRVMLEDGSAPAESIAIERVCSGAPHTEGYTDSKGYFSIRLGDTNNGVMHDASEDMSGFGALGGGNPLSGSGGPMTSGGRFGENRYFDCELRARLAGYRSQAVTLANRRPMDPPDVGVILLHRLGVSEGTTVSAAALAAPKDARKAYEKGMEALKKKKFADAIKDFQKTVDVYPKHAAAWVELGRIRVAQGDASEAKAYFEKAAEAEPKFAEPYLEMALIDWKAEHWQQVADTTAKVIQLDSFDYPQAHFMNAVSNYYLKNLDAAEKSAREAVRLDTRRQYATTIRLLGVILAQKQDYAGAAEQLKAYLQTGPPVKDAATVQKQLAQLEQQLAAAKQ